MPLLKDVVTDLLEAEEEMLKKSKRSTGFASLGAHGTVSICRPSSEALLTISSKLKRRFSSSTVGTLENCLI